MKDYVFRDADGDVLTLDFGDTNILVATSEEWGSLLQENDVQNLVDALIAWQNRGDS